MVEAALNVAAQLVVEHSAYGRVMMRDGNRSPFAAPQGVYRSAGDDCWVAIAVTSDEQWAALCGALGLDDLAAEGRLGRIPIGSTPPSRPGRRSVRPAKPQKPCKRWGFPPRP